MSSCAKEATITDSVEMIGRNLLPLLLRNGIKASKLSHLFYLHKILIYSLESDLSYIHIIMLVTRQYEDPQSVLRLNFHGEKSIDIDDLGEAI